MESGQAPLHNVHDLPFIAGRVCIDFSNAAAGWGGPTFHGYIETYADLLVWAERGGLVGPTDAHALERSAAEQPERAARVGAVALALRGTIHAIFAAIAQGTPAPGEAVAALDTALAGSLPHRHLVADPAGFRWAWQAGPALDRPLWPL